MTDLNKTRVGVQHEPAYEDERCKFSAHDVMRIECPDIPLLGRMRSEIDVLPTDLVKLNYEINCALAQVMAAGFDYGVMAARANPNAQFIDERNARILETMHSSDPETSAARTARSVGVWLEDCERAPVDWVEVDETMGQLRVKKANVPRGT